MSEHGHGGHGHGGVHGTHGADGQGLAQSLGLNQGQHGHNFISQLLGLEHEHGGHGAHGGPSQTASWNSAMQNMNLQNALQGITLTQNFLWLMLFLGMAAWLFVVYWIRHNEPLANSVLGNGAAHSATGAHDRRLISGIKRTMPVVTSPTTGEIYVPNKPFHLESEIPPIQAPMPSPQPPQPLPLNHFGAPTGPSSYGIPNFYQAPTAYPYYGHAPMSQSGAYMVHSSSPGRVKMVVNR